MINFLAHVMVYHELPSTTRRENLTLADELDAAGQPAMSNVLREAYVGEVGLDAGQRSLVRRLVR